MEMEHPVQEINHYSLLLNSIVFFYVLTTPLSDKVWLVHYLSEHNEGCEEIANRQPKTDTKTRIGSTGKTVTGTFTLGFR
ncbi:MAG: hypothetical protein ACQEWE_17775 [Bacillota bacterium]